MRRDSIGSMGVFALVSIEPPEGAETVHPSAGSLSASMSARDHVGSLLQSPKHTASALLSGRMDLGSPVRILPVGPSGQGVTGCLPSTSPTIEDSPRLAPTSVLGPVAPVGRGLAILRSNAPSRAAVAIAHSIRAMDLVEDSQFLRDANTEMQESGSGDLHSRFRATAPTGQGPTGIQHNMDGSTGEV